MNTKRNVVKSMNLGVTGDLHGDLYFKKIYKAKKLGYTHLIVCGDFGYIWDGSLKEQKHINFLNKIGIKVLFIDGNHENHVLLNQYKVSEMFEGKVHKIRDNIIHLMRGEYYIIDDKTFWCMGGAKSSDVVYTDYTGRKKYRIEGKHWWKEEIPSQEEFEYGRLNLEKHNYTADYIITHTSYSEAITKVSGENRFDNVSEYLRDIETRVHGKIKYWYFGHMHCDFNIKDSNTRCVYNDIVEL